MPQQQYGTRGGLAKADTGIRKVAPTFGKDAFLTHASKAANTFLVESNAERLGSHLLAIDPAIRTYQPQPYTVDLIDGLILRSQREKQEAKARHKERGEDGWMYTPDFSMLLSFGGEGAMEVKLEGYTGDEAYAGKLARATHVLSAHGMKLMRLVIPSYWRHPLRTNLPLLHQASLRKDLMPGPEILLQIERLGDRGAATLRDYCGALGMNSRMAPVLIVFGALDVDIVHNALCYTTPAKPAYGALDHLNLLSRLAK